MQALAGPVAAPSATMSAPQNFVIAALTALRPAPAVTNPPVITSITTSGITASGATVSWTTDQPADSQVDFGPTAAYGSSTTLDPSLVTAHSETITGLAAGLTSAPTVKR